MSDNKDYQAGYRGDQFHHGMGRSEYERGKGQKKMVAQLMEEGQ